jgi:hypothetical protein
MSTEQTQTRPEPRDEFTKPGFIVALVGMVILVLALLLVVISGIIREPSTGGNPLASSCDLPASDRTSIIGAPEAGWERVSPSLSIPSHPEYGPGTFTEGVHHCYAESPEGAVFAAMNMVALDLTGHSHDLYSQLTIDGPQREELLSGTPPVRAHSPGNPRLVGYNLIDYRQDTATVEVIIRDDNSTTGVTFDLVRQGPEWKFRPPTSLQPPVRAIRTNDSFTALSEGE